MSKLAKALTAAAGNAAGESLYAEDVFSTYLYTGNGTARTITNDVDLAGEGGLVWLKDRSQAQSNYLFDTENGANKFLISDLTAAISTVSNRGVTAFNSNGFDLGSSSGGNRSGDDYASWTFRKAEKFFDVVTYTGNSTAGRTVSHNLGSVPAVIIVKKTSSASSSNWYVYHSSLGSSAHILLNTTAAADTASSGWNNTNPTSTEFTLSNNVNVNASGESFVAYLFASDAGGFGDDGSENIIKCGSYVEPSSGNWLEIDCGFEAQWVMVKSATSASQWTMFDVMRDATGQYVLQASSSNAEANFGSGYLTPTATGFKARGGLLGSGQTIIYIAIRRPMKTPESGTEVFDVDFGNNVTSSGDKVFPSSITVDALLYLLPSGGGQYFYDRMRGGQKVLQTSSTAAETSGGFPQFDTQTGVNSSTVFNFSSRVGAAFKRATGFFDVVAYTGDGTNPRTINHNLGVTPELMIIKDRTATWNWFTFFEFTSSGCKRLFLNLTNSEYSVVFSDTGQQLRAEPTDSIFTVGSNAGANASGDDYIAYLFATLAGVSKVGSYTGNGGSSVQQIDCGFSSGARFILIKDADGTNDWYVWDSARGIVAGNDPYLRLNQTAAENPDYDWVDPYSAGFEVTTDATAAFRINVSGRKYIFLAIA